MKGDNYMTVPCKIGGVIYTRKMCLEYLAKCRDVLFTSNKMLAAGTDFALWYFADATKYLIDQETSFDEAEKKRQDE